MLLDSVNNPEIHEGRLLLSRPYQTSGVALGLSRNAALITDYRQLQPGQKVGVMVGSVASVVLGKAGKTTSPYAFQTDMVEDLEKGELYAIAVSSATMSYYIRQNPDAGLQLAYAFDGEPDLSWEVSVGLRKSDKALVDAINAVLDKLIADGTLTAIYQHYGWSTACPERPWFVIPCSETTTRGLMNFCSNCGAHLSRRIPPGDNLPRYVCDACNTHLLREPEDDRGLRGRVGRQGAAVPACDRAALRPVDRAGRVPGKRRDHRRGRPARNAGRGQRTRGDRRLLRAVQPAAHQPDLHAVPGPPARSDFSAGAETLETRLVDEHEVPWSEIAFATVRNTLIHYFNDRRKGEFGFHMGTIEPMARAV